MTTVASILPTSTERRRINLRRLLRPESLERERRRVDPFTDYTSSNIDAVLRGCGRQLAGHGRDGDHATTSSAASSQATAHRRFDRRPTRVAAVPRSWSLKPQRDVEVHRSVVCVRHQTRESRRLKRRRHRGPLGAGVRTPPRGSGLGKIRWVVERTLSWVVQARRLKIRYDQNCQQSIGRSTILQLARICCKILQKDF